MECFRDITKTSPMSNGGVKPILDMMLTRYVYHLIVLSENLHKGKLAHLQINCARR